MTLFQLDNPIYHSSSTMPNEEEHEYEELDKLGHRQRKFTQSNSYDQVLQARILYLVLSRFVFSSLLSYCLFPACCCVHFVI